MRETGDGPVKLEKLGRPGPKCWTIPTGHSYDSSVLGGRRAARLRFGSCHNAVQAAAELDPPPLPIPNHAGFDVATECRRALGYARFFDDSRSAGGASDTGLVRVACSRIFSREKVARLHR